MTRGRKNYKMILLINDNCKKITEAQMTWKEKLEIYDKLVAKCPRFERKGKTGPYTSANGHMFSFLNKDGELGIRFSKEVQEKYIKDFDTAIF